jgi:hypothetical protein
MKTFLPLLATAVLATAAHADLTITQKVQQEAQPAADLTVTMKIKGQKMRMDASPQVSTIIDLKSGDMQNLMHDQKMVMTIPGALIKGLKQAAAPSASAGTELPKPTGNKETISGFACDEYTLTSQGAKVNVWLTKDLPAAQQIMSEVSALSPDNDPFQAALKGQKIDGFPLRTVIETPGVGKTTMTVVAVNESPLADSEFSVPSGYKTMQMPSLPR